jgi:hypothetical protein
MKRFFSSPIVALLAGLCLRLFFVLKFPATSGDTVLYEQMATNWLKHGVYAMNVGGAIQPVDLRMPGYPAYLILIYWLTGKTGPDAHFAVMLGQVAVDLATCGVVSLLAIFLVIAANQAARVGRAGIIALWLAALCPFTANYVAVPLTEAFAIFFTAAATLLLVLLFQFSIGGVAIAFTSTREVGGTFFIKHCLSIFAIMSGLLIGLATLLRPESPILLLAALLTLAIALFRRNQMKAWLRITIITGLAFLVPLLPWAVRNAITFHELRFLSPKNSNLPGELVPYGFMAWEKTWLFRMKDCYLAPWKLNEEPIEVDSLPARAFDSPEEKQRVAQILEPYNTDLTLTPEEDAAFAEIARERTRRHPLRTYLILPALRAVVLWFTPRIELLPVSGHVFPIGQMWEDDKVDQAVTSGLFLLNFFYVAFALWGATKLWRCGEAARYSAVFFLLFALLRTAFLTTLETPEPRYVLECFPALIALGAFALSAPAFKARA